MLETSEINLDKYPPQFVAKKDVEDMMVATRKDVQDIVASGLAPLLEHFQRMEQTLEALVDFDGPSISPMNIDALALQEKDSLLNNSGELDAEEEKKSKLRTDEEHPDRHPEMRKPSKSFTSEAMNMDKRAFREEMAKCGVGGKGSQSFRSQGIIDFISWLQEWITVLEAEPARTGCLSRIVGSTYFDALCIGVIFANSFFVAYSADWAMTNIGESPPGSFGVVEKVFTFYFVIELILKMTVHRWYFFTNSEKAWNWFDFILVSISLLDILLIEVIKVGGGGNMSFMRILRLMKLSKILRAFRTLKFFKELAIMMDSFRRSFVTLWWSLVMMGFILFVFALIFLQGLADVIAAEHTTMDPQKLKTMKDKFGSMSTSVLTLYQSVTGGDDWSGAYDTVALGGNFYGLVFLLFTFFFILALFNILTGIIVEKAVEAAAPDRQELIMAQRNRQASDQKELEHMVKLMDADGDGTIDWPEFREMMGSAAFATYMASVGLEVHDVHHFFDILAGSGQTLDMASFVDGCMKMRGEASSIDMQRLLFETGRLNTETRKFQEESRNNIKRLEDLVRVSTPTSRFTPKSFKSSPKGSPVSSVQEKYSQPSSAKSIGRTEAATACKDIYLEVACSPRESPRCGKQDAAVQWLRADCGSFSFSGPL